MLWSDGVTREAVKILPRICEPDFEPENAMPSLVKVKLFSVQVALISPW